MMLRYAVLAAGLVACGPAFGQQMDASEARRFVIGKLFTFSCFEGTKGSGRIYSDGSVAGSIQFKGQGPVRFAALPANTLRENGATICASVKGLPFEPCFNLQRIDNRSFRGSINGLGFAYCDFTRRGGGRLEMAKASSRPLALRPSQQADAQ